MQVEVNQLQEANKGARLGNAIVDTVCVLIIYLIVELAYSLVYTALYDDYPSLPGFLFYLI